MLPADLKGLYEAYNQVYNNDVDLITDDLIEEVIEELIEECVNIGYSLNEAAEVVEEAAVEYLMELNPYAPAGSKEARAYQKSTTATKRGVERKAAVKGAVERVKAKAKGAVAAAGIAGSIAKDEVRRAGRAATHAVGSAVQKKKAEVKKGVKGLLKKGLSAVAGGAGAVAQKARKVGAAAGRAADKLGEEVEVEEGFRPIPAGRQREAMIKRASNLTRQALTPSSDYADIGDGGKGSPREKAGKINDALRDPKLRKEELEATGLFSDEEIQKILETAKED